MPFHEVLIQFLLTKKYPPVYLLTEKDPQDLIGRAKLFDISAARQYQGGKYIFGPHISRLARKNARFTERSLAFGRAH